MSDKISAFATLALALIVLLSGCAPHAGHDHDHDHDHDHADEVPKGRHGGRLLIEGQYTIEILLDERNETRFLVWLYDNDMPVAPARSAVQVVTERLGGERTTFEFESEVNRWRSIAVVEEPHSFDVEVRAQIDGKSVTASYPSYEGRTNVDASSAAAAGIVSASVAAGSLSETIETSGVLRPDATAEARVVARFAGVVRSIDVRLGDRVRQGQTLATIDSNLSLSSYPLIAPISGTVAAIHSELGGSVDGDTVVTLINAQKLRADLLLYGLEAQRVEIGAAVEVENLSDGSRAKGRISQLSPALDVATQSIAAQVTFSAGADSWRPGAAVRAQITLKEFPVAIRLPRSALQNYRGATVVFFREGNVFEARPVRLGRQNRDYVEVLAGLSAGQEVVVAQSFLVKADIEKSSAAHEH